MSEHNIHEIIEKLISDNEGNKNTLDDHDSFIAGHRTGYYEGYHDALVDLLNKLGIQHNHEIYN